MATTEAPITAMRNSRFSLTRIIRTKNDDCRYGPATGENSYSLDIANEVVLENELFLDPALYNTTTMLLQPGIDPLPGSEQLVHNKPAGYRQLVCTNRNT